jgi:hypothetical protein
MFGVAGGARLAGWNQRARDWRERASLQHERAALARALRPPAG